VSAAPAAPAETTAYEYPKRPVAPDGPLDDDIAQAVDAALGAATFGTLDGEAVALIGTSGDARLAWLLADLMRFQQEPADQSVLVEAFSALTGVDPAGDPRFAESRWRSVTDHLIAWDLPDPPDYRVRKARLFLAVEPRWAPFLADAKAEVDWRLVSWGGVLIDDRAEGDPAPCPLGCIPALDDPGLTGAEQGGWYPDDGVVFGLVVGDDAVALPKNVMEVHEMVNLTVGGRRLGVPYCTLCGAAMAYFTDQVADGPPLVLRTSGLLSRSNKMTYELRTRSLIDTFTGRALSGPLHDAGVELEPVTVITSSWGAWRREHPSTRMVAEDGGIGKGYPSDPLGGRDDDGPIFPIGPTDERLPVQAQVVGVLAPDGTAVAFPADQARTALLRGERVALGGVELVSDGDGFRAQRADGADRLVSSQAFWFAWSQFHPGTAVWTPRRG